jgi:DNA-binding MarR family transcriptional regulator
MRRRIPADRDFLMMNPAAEYVASLSAHPNEGADRPSDRHPPAAEALRRFRTIFRSVRTGFQEAEQRCGIPGSQLWALSVVVQNPGVRVKELAQAMAIQQSTASNLVEQLVRQTLISRERSITDQRSVRLHPTERGRSLVAQAQQPLTGMLPHALSRLDPHRLQQLTTLLDEVVSSMRPGRGQG